MRQTWRNLLLRGVCIGLASSLSAPLAKAATPEQVNATLEKAVSFVNKSQQGDNWEGGLVKADQNTGPTAIAVYALLAAGQTSQTNPKLNAAIQWLLKNDTKGVYALGLRAQVWNLVEHDKNQAIRDAIKKDAVLLLEGARKAANVAGYRGLYHYTVDARSYDHSCSQYGVLGMWALERAGLEVPDEYWEAVESALKLNQEFDGGWSYNKGNVKGSSVAMTAAGIATLFITQDYLRSMDGIKCTGNISNIPIDKGMKWMEKNLDAELKARKVNSYGLYGIERIGVASGYKYFGTLDWYKTGAEFFVKTQSAEGSWGGFGGPVPATCFGILFLSRGRAPVVMNKLEYKINGKEANWNQRPRDAANVTRYVAKQMERDLNWQIVNLGVEVNDFHDSQILYISGNQALEFTAAEEAKLKQFVEEGGMILGHADCAEPTFAKSFKTLGMKLFKNAGAEFRPIKQDHPIYTRQQFQWKNWKNKPALEGLSNGVREMMLLIPTGDPAKAWQLQDDKSKEEQFQFMSDIFLYAVEGKDLRFKGSTYIVNKEGNSASKTVKVARIDVGDNSDPEPGGWKRLGAILHNSFSTDVDTTTVKLKEKSLDAFKLAHLTGTGKLKLTAEHQAVLKDFVNNGGTLVVDAAGGDSDFSATAEDALNAMFGNDAKQLQSALPVSHPLFSASGAPLGDVSFRSFARGKVPRGQVTPLLRGITINGRLAVIFSREDLSGGMVGESIDGIIGYVPESATALMRNIVLFTGSGGKAVAPAAPKEGPFKPAPSSKPADPATETTKPTTEKA